MQPHAWTTKIKELAFAVVMLGFGVSVYQLGQKDIFGMSSAPKKLSTPAPAPAPTVEPITLTIHVPQPAMVIEGVSTLFLAETTGPAGNPEWRVVPPSAGTIRKTSPDGRRVEMLANGEGKCTLLVDVAGDGRQLATKMIEIDVVSFGAAPDKQPDQHDMPPPVPEKFTVAQLVTGALANLQPDVRKDSGKVSGVIKSVIARIEAGHLPPDTNVVAVIESQLKQAMGVDAGNWNGFIAALDAIVEQLRIDGVITTVAGSVPTLAEVTAALDAAH